MNSIATIIKNDAEHIANQVDASFLNNKTLLLTGASGLIGTYVLATLDAYREKNINVRVFATAQNELPLHLKNLNAQVTFLQGDITDHKFLTSLPIVDCIIHAAGYGQPGKFMENPIKTIEINTTGTMELFKKLKPDGKFLFLSTSEVYSGLTNPPHKEDEIGTTNTIHPRSCYIEGKRCGEAIVNAYRQKGIDAKSGRLSLVYGPGTKPSDTRVLNSFIFKAIREKKITLMDQGEAKRTYCYVTDAVELLLRIFFHGKEPIYNVGGFSKTTIGELAKKIGVCLGVPVMFPENPSGALKGAPDDVSLDMSKTMNEFSKKDFTTLDDGLKKTIDWQKILYDSQK